MKELFSQRTNCRLCGSSGISLALHLEPTPSGDNFISKEHLNIAQPPGPLDLMLCSACGNVQLSHVINPHTVYENYLYTSSVSLELSEHFRAYARDVIKKTGAAKGSLVVEVGSNEGAMLRPFKAEGFSVVGIDPAREIAKRATESGVETLPAYFNAALAEKIVKERGKASLIIANNVFANIDDLQDFAEGLRVLLSDNGTFVFETSYLLDVVDKGLIDTIFHEHVTYFSVKPLVEYFRKNGMTLVDADRVPTKGGSLRGYAKLRNEKNIPAPAVQKLISVEKQTGLYGKDAYRKLSEKLDAVKKELHALLQKMAGAGKTIDVYGAAVGLTTMLYHFDLGKFFRVMYDDNPVKQHLYSPGLHLPVLPSSEIYTKSPDCIVVLAWRYTDTILSKHKRFLDNGGTFIVPLPEVRVKRG